MGFKNRYLLLILFTALGCTQTKSSKRAVNENSVVIPKTKSVAESEKTIETISVDLNDDGKVDTIYLSIPVSGFGPGTFNKIYVSLTGLNQYAFTTKDVWGKIDADFLSKNINAVHSDNVFIYKKAKNTLLMLFGYVYGAGREDFTVVQIKENTAKLVYQDQMEWPLGFIDCNHDHHFSFLGKRSSSEVSQKSNSLNAEICTYDPYTVYNMDAGFKIDNELTQQYNEQNYVWAGMQPEAEIKALMPKNGGKPKIVK